MDHAPDLATALLENINVSALILDATLTPIYLNPLARQQQTIDRQLAKAEFLSCARRVIRRQIAESYQPELPSWTTKITLVPFGEYLAVLSENLDDANRLDMIKRDFIANMSHELKTPVAAIGLLAEAIKKSSKDPKLVRRFAKSLVKESRRLGDLCRDIIRLSDAQSALSPEQQKPISLALLVRDLLDTHQIFASQNKVELLLSDELEIEAIIRGQENALYTAIGNVLVNAIQHSPVGKKVQISLLSKNRCFVVQISDEGEGIAEAHLARIFERFYRIDGARTRDKGGTGLGLSITRNIIRAHGGEVTVVSTPGQGAQFALSFPLPPTANNPESKHYRRLKKAQQIVNGAKT